MTVHKLIPHGLKNSSNNSTFNVQHKEATVSFLIKLRLQKHFLWLVFANVTQVLHTVFSRF